MYCRNLVAAIALGSAAFATPAAAEEFVLAPNTPWTVDYDNDSCALRRTFGTGEDRGYLEMRRFAPGWSLQTTLASNRLSVQRPPNIRYRFGAGEWQVPGPSLSVSLDDDLKGVIFEPRFAVQPIVDKSLDEAAQAAFLQSLDFDAIEREQAAAVTSLTVRSQSREITLDLGRLDAPIKALQDCVAELVTHWGIDVEAHRTLTRQAMPVNYHQGVRMIDYPPKMSVRRMPGLVNIRLAIDDTGKITGCRIQMPLSDPEFAESSCADIQHAFEFVPALDKDGRPIASYWVTKVIFT